MALVFGEARRSADPSHAAMGTFQVPSFFAQHKVSQSESSHRTGTVQYVYIYIQCEAPKVAKLVYNSDIYGLWYL